MPLTRVMLFLAAWIWLAPGPRGDLPRTQETRPHSRAASQAVVRTETGSLAVPIRAGLTRPSVWRHRIKTVVEERNALGLDTVDLGPATIPDHHESRAEAASDAPRTGPPIPLRC